MHHSSGGILYLCLGVQCLVSLSDGLTGHTSPVYNTLAKPIRAPAGSIRPHDAPRDHQPECVMLNAGWAALLAALSVLLTLNLSNPIILTFFFGDVLGKLHMLAHATGAPHCPPHSTRFLVPSPRPHSYHASPPRSTSCNRSRLRCAPRFT